MEDIKRQFRICQLTHFIHSIHRRPDYLNKELYKKLVQAEKELKELKEQKECKI